MNFNHFFFQAGCWFRGPNNFIGRRLYKWGTGINLFFICLESQAFVITFGFRKYESTELRELF